MEYSSPVFSREPHLRAPGTSRMNPENSIRTAGRLFITLMQTFPKASQLSTGSGLTLAIHCFSSESRTVYFLFVSLILLSLSFLN